MAIPKQEEIDLVQSLITGIEALELRDDQRLYALRERAEMVIRKVFGDSSEYIKKLKHINFRPTVTYPGMDSSIYDNSWLEGKGKMGSLFNTMLEDLELSCKVEDPNVEFSNRVFIVHGHDEGMKHAVARTLEKIGLDPIILHERPNEGRTIIEKFTDFSDVSFAVVLLSPDDMAYPKDKSPEDAESRARQNVIFELGFFIGKCGRERVLAIYRKEANFKMPTDYEGVLNVPYDGSGKWQYDLVKELQACGHDVDANKLA